MHSNMSVKKQRYLDPDEHKSTTKIDGNVRVVEITIRRKKKVSDAGRDL